MELFLSQLEARRGKIAADFSPPLSDLGVGEGGPAAKKPRLTLDEGMHDNNIARIVSELFSIITEDAKIKPNFWIFIMACFNEVAYSSPIVS